MKIFVGNLAKDVTEEDLKQAFAAFGQVTSVSIISDKFTGVSRGFGFVEMPGKAESQAAITGLNYQDLKGQSLKVNEARPSPQRGRGGRSW
ncbi:MAG: RNA-binding protein [Betaproteobacteria bacterium]|nr:RNA-binding protein [Betaproteobacteria bacterium]